MTASGPLSDPALLAGLMAGWRRWTGRTLHRVSAGPGWLRLHLEGDERVSLLLTALPGAGLIFSYAGRLPEPLHRALKPERDHPLSRLLDGARLSGAAALPGDRVAALRLDRPRGGDVVLLLQLFGDPGNAVLMDGGAVLLWSWRRPPHRLLARLPDAPVWSAAGSPPAPDAPEPEPDAALRTLAAALVGRQGERARSLLARRRQAAGRLVENLERDLAQADQGETFRRHAEALAAVLHTVRPGTSVVETADLRDGAPLRIELDPALPPAANLDAWFRRARKAEQGRDIIAGRLEDARRDREALDRLAAGLDDLLERDAAAPEAALARLDAWLDWAAAHPGLAAPERRTGRRAAGPDEPARPFRRYLIDEKWEAWVGRSNQENDELTHRASHGRDIWLHAQGVPGSHVILRTAGHPERVPAAVLEKAAALAALHSKARHSGLVPVIHTERRYVRKPRGAPPGTAVCLRDKSLFVAPQVAPGVTAS